MSLKYKLGLTRNRVFEFDNAVLFCGKYGFQKNELCKALSLLCIKEPLITSRICLESDGEAYAVIGEAEQEIAFCDDTCSELISRYEKEGIHFYNRAFDFSYTKDGFLVIAGHTALADARALMYLAIDLYGFYKEPLKSIEPSVINLVSEKVNLPLEVASPIIDRLSADLDLKWQKEARFFSVEDYKNAKERYDTIKGETGHLSAKITSDEMNGLKAYCGQQNMDVVSVVGFAFYDALLMSIPGKKKQNKMNIYTDERLFFVDFEDYRVGAYNGISEVTYKKKLVNGSFADRAKVFHIECYKNATSTFKVFYDDTLLMRVSPSLCDASYMYKAGVFKGKSARKLAENYGCACEKLSDYFYCNLDQEYWRDIKNFKNIILLEPFKMRSATALDFIMCDGEGHISFRFNTDKCGLSLAEKILETATGNIKKLSREQ